MILIDWFRIITMDIPNANFRCWWHCKLSSIEGFDVINGLKVIDWYFSFFSAKNRKALHTRIKSGICLDFIQGLVESLKPHWEIVEEFQSTFQSKLENISTRVSSDVADIIKDEIEHCFKNISNLITDVVLNQGLPIMTRESMKYFKSSMEMSSFVFVNSYWNEFAESYLKNQNHSLFSDSSLQGAYCKNCFFLSSMSDYH